MGYTVSLHTEESAAGEGVLVQESHTVLLLYLFLFYVELQVVMKNFPERL